MQTISVIIPVEPQGSALKSTSSLRDVKWDRRKFEVILCRGKNPARQRNKAASVAKGEILFFLDSDSQADTFLFKKNIFCYEKAKDVACCGGPSLLPRQGYSLFQDLSDSVLSSFFATASSASRYTSRGKRRKTTETELISCNLSIKKKVFEEVGGFSEKLFPNEENELLERIKQKGYSLIYEPEAKVKRYPEKNLFFFLRHIFHYGRGRTEQFFIKKHFNFLFNLIPFLFLCYIIVLSFHRNFYLAIPLLLYLFLNLSFSYKQARLKKKYIFLFFLPPLFFLLHLSYGLGIFYGLFTSFLKTKKNEFYPEVSIEMIKNFDEENF